MQKSIDDQSERPGGTADPTRAPTAADALSPLTGRRHGRLSYIALALMFVAILSSCGYAVWMYFTQWRFEVSTDDAYVQADIVTISPQIAGNIAALYVEENQMVVAGQLLATIDQRTFQAAVDEARANVTHAKAAIVAKEAQLAQQQALIAEAKATIDADKALEVFAEQDNQRSGTLSRDGYGSVQSTQRATAQAGSARATVAKDVAALTAAEKQTETLAAEVSQARATLAQAEAALEQAQISLGFTTIISPIDGEVGNRTARVGAYVQPGTQLLSIVPLARTYVVANFKETQLSQLRPNQSVAISVDSFDGEVIRGSVNSFAPASGQEFSLLPPDNATGNFTKIVQRIPIKITIDATDPLAGQLRPGMSVTATVDIRDPTSKLSTGR